MTITKACEGNATKDMKLINTVLCFFGLVIAAGFLYGYLSSRDDGRYEYYSTDAENLMIDTRTGSLYTFYVEQKKMARLDFPKGEWRMYDIVKK
jgi:hypothetical protein